jgi:hypothetical protein
MSFFWQNPIFYWMQIILMKQKPYWYSVRNIWRNKFTRNCTLEIKNWNFNSRRKTVSKSWINTFGKKLEMFCNFKTINQGFKWILMIVSIIIEAVKIVFQMVNTKSTLLGIALIRLWIAQSNSTDSKYWNSERILVGFLNITIL